MFCNSSIAFVISIHSLHTEGDILTPFLFTPFAISIHSLHTEGDCTHLQYRCQPRYFNPLPPHGGRPDCFEIRLNRIPFQSTPSTRRETFYSFAVLNGFVISIHSLHTEGDRIFEEIHVRRLHFNPLPPHGGRHASFCLSPCTDQFQSTPSTRRETSAGDVTGVKISISIHSLHTEGDLLFSALPTPCSISIHSLHTEGDKTEKQLVVDEVISIHSLHTEGDAAVLDSLDSLRYFNPLPPHGGRQ